MLLRAIHGSDFVVCLHTDGRATYNDRPIRGLKGAVVDGAAGFAHYALQGEDGKLYWCCETRAKHVAANDRAISVACGVSHTTVALAGGAVAMHTGRKWYRVPMPCAAKSVYSGNGASAALCEDGVLYTWGHNRSMQLGRAASTPDPAPVQLPGRVVDFGYGLGFGAALLEDGRVYAWGFGSVPRPARMGRTSHFTRLAVGRAYIAAAHADRSCITMTGTVGTARVQRYVQEQDFPVSALLGGWATPTLRAEYMEDSSEHPSGRSPLALGPHRWQARRILLLCVIHEQARKARKRSRACADGVWSNKLPLELWREVVRYLG